MRNKLFAGKHHPIDINIIIIIFIINGALFKLKKTNSDTAVEYFIFRNDACFSAGLFSRANF